MTENKPNVAVPLAILGGIMASILFYTSGYVSGLDKGIDRGAKRSRENTTPIRAERKKDVNGDGIEDLMIRGSEPKYNVLFGIPKDLIVYVTGPTRGTPTSELTYVSADQLKEAMRRRANSSTQRREDEKYSKSLDDAVKKAEGGQ